MDIHKEMTALGQRAKAAARVMARADTRAKDAALLALAGLLETEGRAIAAANAATWKPPRPPGWTPRVWTGCA